MGVPDKSTNIHKDLSTYPTAQDTFVSKNKSTSDGAISSHDRYCHSDPILDARMSVLLAIFVLLPLDSETWWSRELLGMEKNISFVMFVASSKYGNA